MCKFCDVRDECIELCDDIHTDLGVLGNLLTTLLLARNEDGSEAKLLLATIGEDESRLNEERIITIEYCPFCGEKL